jgi:hypothetical protein
VNVRSASSTDCSPDRHARTSFLSLLEQKCSSCAEYCRPAALLSSAALTAASAATTSANDVHAKHAPWSRTGDMSGTPPVSLGLRASKYAGAAAAVSAAVSSWLADDAQRLPALLVHAAKRLAA